MKNFLGVACILFLGVINDGTFGNKPVITSNSHLSFVYKRAVIAFCNDTTETFVKLDYHTSISAYFNCKTDQTFVFNPNVLPAVYIPPNVTHKTLCTKTECFKENNKHPVPLEDLFEIGLKEGIQVDATTISKDLLKKLENILISTSFNYSTVAGGNRAFASALEISKRSKINRIDKKVVPKSVKGKVRGDLHSYFGRITGMYKFFSPVDGFKKLIENNITYDLKKILEIEDGFALIVYFLTQLASQKSLIKLLEDPINKESWFFETAAELSGNIDFGYDGFLLVVAKIVSYVSGEISKQYLRLVLQGYFTNIRATETDLKTLFIKSISKFGNSIEELNLEDNFKHLKKVIEDIKKGKWMIRQTNISEVVDVVIAADFKKESVQKVFDTLKK